MAELRREQLQPIHQFTAFARRAEQQLQFGFELRDVLPELFDLAIHRMAHGRLRGLTTCCRHPTPRRSHPGYAVRTGLVQVFRRTAPGRRMIRDRRADGQSARRARAPPVAPKICCSSRFLALTVEIPAVQPKDSMPDRWETGWADTRLSGSRFTF